MEIMTKKFSKIDKKVNELREKIFTDCEKASQRIRNTCDEEIISAKLNHKRDVLLEKVSQIEADCFIHSDFAFDAKKIYHKLPTQFCYASRKSKRKNNSIDIKDSDEKDSFGLVSFGQVFFKNDFTLYKKFFYSNFFNPLNRPKTFPDNFPQSTKKFFTLDPESQKPRFLMFNYFNGDLRLYDCSLRLIREIRINQNYIPTQFKIQLGSNKIIISFLSLSFKFSYIYVFDTSLKMIKLKKLNWAAEIFLLSNQICYSSCYIRKQYSVMDFNLKFLGNFKPIKSCKQLVNFSLHRDRFIFEMKDKDHFEIFSLLKTSRLMKSIDLDQIPLNEIEHFTDSQENFYIIRKKSKESFTKRLYCYNSYGYLLFKINFNPFNRYKYFDFCNEKFYFYNEQNQLKCFL
jgi:hypothetical protein